MKKADDSGRKTMLTEGLLWTFTLNCECIAECSPLQVRKKKRSFDLQLSTFPLSTCKQLRSLHEYLSPKSQATPLVLPSQTIDILRNEYQIKCQIRTLSRLVNRHKLRRRSSHMISLASQPSPCPSTERVSVYLQPRRQSLMPQSEGMGFAMARLRAHKKVIGRLSRQGEEIAREVPSPFSAF